MERLHLHRIEAEAGPFRAKARAPEGLVRVDVADPRDGTLVEEHGLDRRTPSGQRRCEPCRRERGGERLRPEPGREVVVQLVPLEHEPGSEAPDVSVDDVRSVV